MISRAVLSWNQALGPLQDDLAVQQFSQQVGTASPGPQLQIDPIGCTVNDDRKAARRKRRDEVLDHAKVAAIERIGESQQARETAHGTLRLCTQAAHLVRVELPALLAMAARNQRQHL